MFFSRRLERLIAPLVGALDRAYHDALDNHSGSPGANETTFGTDVYHFACHYITELAAQGDLLIVDQLAAPKFRMRAAEYMMACHRVGQHDGQDIHRCTPRAPGAGTMAEHLQLKLFDDSINLPALADVRKLVLAHFGNHADGLCAVYLCVAAHGAEDEKIKGWAHTELLWKRSGQISENPSAYAPSPAPGAGSSVPAPPPPELETDGEPRLRPDTKKKQG